MAKMFGGSIMEIKTFKIEDVYVPVNRLKTLNVETVTEIANDILENGQLTPILVRQGKGRVVLVEGFHRLKACESLGEETISGYIVQARRK